MAANNTQFGSRVITVGSQQYYPGPLANELQRAVVPVLLNQPLFAEDGYTLVCRTAGVSVPHSFYGVNSTNNVLTITVGGTTASITITPGQYSVYSFRTAIQTQLTATFASDAPVLTFNAITSSFIFTPTTLGISLDFTGTSAMATPLGFYSGYTYPTTGLSVTALSSVKSPILSSLASGNVYIHTDLTNRFNLTTETLGGTQSTLLQVVPINSPYNSFITLTNASLVTPMYISNAVVNYFFVFLRDGQGNLIDLRGIDWDVTLEFSIERLPVDPAEFVRHEPSDKHIENVLNETPASDLPGLPPVKRKRVFTELMDVPSVPESDEKIYEAVTTKPTKEKDNDQTDQARL